MLLDGPCRSSLAVANGIGANTIAFPAISCGVYGYPLKHACTVSLSLYPSANHRPVACKHAVPLSWLMQTDLQPLADQ